MGYLGDVRSALNKQLPLWSRGHVIPKGVVLPIDPYLHGTHRCAKKIGDKMPVVVPNNEARLSAALTKKDTIVQLSTHSLDYVKSGYLMSLAGRQIITVAAIDSSSLTIAYDQSLLDTQQGSQVDLEAGDSVYVYGIPCKAVSNVDKGGTIIQFRSPAPVMRGDVLAISTKISGVYREYEVVELLSEVHDAETLPYYYQVRLQSIAPDISLPANISAAQIEVLTNSDSLGLYRALVDNESIYIRAYPAYFSKYIPIPMRYPGSLANVGPYLLDRVSGLLGDNPAGEGKSLEDLLCIQFHSIDLSKRAEVQLRQDIASDDANTRVQSAQFPVWVSAIEPEHAVLWDVDKGTLELTSENLVLCADADGMCMIHKDLVPEPGAISGLEILPTYRITLFSTAAFKAAVTFYPNEPIITSVVEPDSSGAYITTLKVPLSGFATRPQAIKIATFASPDQRVYLHSIAPMEPSVTHVRYQMLTKTTGSYHWASSGLLLKPIFLSAKVTNAHGYVISLDAGEVMFDAVNPPPRRVVLKTPLQAFLRFASVVDAPGTVTVSTTTQANGGTQPYSMFEIDWGDGSARSTTPNDSHTYVRGAEDTKYTVVLRVTDAKGKTSLDTRVLTISSVLSRPIIAQTPNLYNMILAGFTFSP